ncbi:MAG: Lrp/AsnC family transcriptional regulator [Burkholderiaceae bacterium]|nr:Lrp/AsnC family transcriptional regulator [Burkholderiaceae bacterium]
MTTAKKTEFDRLDRAILDVLQKNARISNVDLANAVGLSPAPCLRRVQVLEESGVIQGYVGLVDMRSVSLGVDAFIQVQMASQVKRLLDIFEDTIKRFSCILECYVMTGDWDYMLHVVAQDMDDIQHFLQDNISQIEGVKRIKTTFAIRNVIKTTALPLNHLGGGK